MFTSCFLWKVWPKTRTSPESGTVMPIIMRMLLVFPAPLGPSRPNTFPAGIASDRSSTATNLSNDLRTWISSTVFFMDTLLQFAHYYVRDLPMERHPCGNAKSRGTHLSRHAHLLVAGLPDQNGLRLSRLLAAPSTPPISLLSLP